MVAELPRFGQGRRTNGPTFSGHLPLAGSHAKFARPG